MRLSLHWGWRRALSASAVVRICIQRDEARKSPSNSKIFAMTRTEAQMLINGALSNIRKKWEINE